MKKLIILYKIINSIIRYRYNRSLNLFILLEHIRVIGLDSLFIILLTAFCIGCIFSLQIVKEFIYLNMINLIGSVLTTAFLRELSPVLTAIIVIGRVGSYFTSEIATMQITEQIDALYILNIDPIYYLVLPRVIALAIILPILNFVSFITSLSSSIFICFTLYNIDPYIFYYSALSKLFFFDIIYSSIKSFIFGIIISIISCIWGLSTEGGAKNVGISTTSSVVICLVCLFIVDFFLSYLMFNKLSITLMI